MKVKAEEAASPASFQPWKAATRAGARKPSGRRSQRNGCIRTTVHHGFVPSTALGPVPEPPSLPALRAGDDVDLVLACSRKERLMARSGSPYLALELRDRSGAITARAFRDADV